MKHRNHQTLFHLLSSAMNSTGDLFWIYDELDCLVYANTNFFLFTGLCESAAGSTLDDISSVEVAALIRQRLEATRNQDKVLFFTEKMLQNNSEQYYESHWFNIKSGKSRFVAGYARNCTVQKRKSLEIQKLASRLSYISLNTSEFVWEWESDRNKLRIHEKLNKICGYYSEVKHSGIGFWMQQIVHREDRVGLLRKIVHCIKNGAASLKLHYRIIAKSGETRWVSDTIHFVYRFGRPYRVLGSLKDRTEVVALETEIKQGVKEKEKAVHAAGVKAQEEVRDNISKELHDNINQLILSSKLYISIARRQPDIADQMLDKAIEYQYAALEEGRKLSKQLSVAVIQQNGFSKSLNEITGNLTLNKISVTAGIDSTVVQKLSDAQSTMLIRILQEQSSNILKYANPAKVEISLTENNGLVTMQINDDGNGFDQSQNVPGIGLSNIRSRVLALDGTFDIRSSPGNGCSMKVEFKIFQAEKVNAA